MSAETIESSQATENRGNGHRLTKTERHELIKFVRNGLINGLHPRTVREAIQAQFRIGRKTAEQYIAEVRQEQLKEVGYFKHQIQDICQKALVKIVNKASSEAATVRAVQMLHNIFDIRVTPEDTSEAQRVYAEEAMAKMDKMSIQELTEFAEAIRQGGEKLSPEMLLLNPQELEEHRDEESDKRRKRKVRK